jgi:signal transduction histidine kinase
MSSELHLAHPQSVTQRSLGFLRSKHVRTVAGMVAIVVAYYGAAKVGQALRYTASVSAIWPPAGLGIAVLYLWGLRWWPAIFLGELLVNAELYASDSGIPFWSIVGQQAGNMLEILVGAILLKRFIGPRAGLDRADQIVGMLVALACGTAISAVVGTASMLAGDVIEPSEGAKFCRTWWLGDTAGGLVTLPLILTWAHDPARAWRRIRTWEGTLLVATITVLSVISVSADEPITYMVFPALIWAALRFGPAGATLSVAVAALTAIGFTANEVGPFFKQAIDHRTLNTQLYVGVAAITALFVQALVSEREQSTSELAHAKRRGRERAVEERNRIARELHDSVSQALFSTVLHTRTAQRALDCEQDGQSENLRRALTAISQLTVGAQLEMRALLLELKEPAADGGLVAALTRHALSLRTREELMIDVLGPERRLPLSPEAEEQLFAIGREALANVVKHSGARRAFVRVDEQGPFVSLEIRDNGHGFDSAAVRPGHYGLDSMRSRAAELGAILTIRGRPGDGTVVRVETRANVDQAVDADS